MRGPAGEPEGVDDRREVAPVPVMQAGGGVGQFVREGRCAGLSVLRIRPDLRFLPGKLTLFREE